MIKVKTLFESVHRLLDESIVSVQVYPSLQGKQKYSVTWIKNYKQILTDPMRLNYSESNPKHNTLRPVITEIHSFNWSESSALQIAKILENEIIEFYKFEKDFNNLFNLKNHFNKIENKPLLNI